MFYWLTFEDGSKACCQGDTPEDATQIAENLTGNAVISAKVLPYPANPIIWQNRDIPAFCYNPDACAGKTCCPNHPCCVD